MAGGRPTRDPKGTLMAVRLSSRQLRILEARARREDIGLSEALRRCVDEWATASSRPSSPPRVRPPSPEERQTFGELFAALGARPRRRRR